MANDLTFEPLPDVIGRGDRYVMEREFAEILPQLRLRPKQWACVKTLGTGTAAKRRAHSWASLISSGKSPTFGQDYKAVTRTREDGTVTLWMSYVGSRSRTR